MATITVKNASGVDTPVELPLVPGRAAAATSRPIALSTEDKTALDLISTKLDTAITALQIIDNMVLQAGTSDIGKVKVTNNAGTVIDPIAAVAHDAVDSGEPNKIGGTAVAGLSSITLVAAGDRTNANFSTDGAQFVRPDCGLNDIVSAVVACTAGANTSALAAQGVGLKIYVEQVIIVNNGAANGSLILTDGSAGATKAKLPFPASTGATITFKKPLGFTDNTAVFADPTGTDTIDVTIIGFKSKV